MPTDDWVRERAEQVAWARGQCIDAATESLVARIAAFGQEAIERTRSEERALAAEAMKLAQQREARLWDALHWLDTCDPGIILEIETRFNLSLDEQRVIPSDEKEG